MQAVCRSCKTEGETEVRCDMPLMKVSNGTTPPLLLIQLLILVIIPQLPLPLLLVQLCCLVVLQRSLHRRIVTPATCY
jgi:hypothetical protein